ncbi:wax ester/triacylglycerol synthase domain-containing protein [Sporichthya polymorpha]|uniref:wax ester/triacylglycerol synthase domain-containing protein n=1 Tax=Sporichthya polymorpha TaxID=35751 RepID=UPI000372FDB6|nr:wax ester/triacylglycerol synthase domain-containing protein [Sporichthya polymorpha]
MSDAIDPVWPTTAGMNPFESVMWRLDAAPMLRVPTLSCEELDSVPDWDRFLAAHEWAVRMAPQFRLKVVEPPFGLGTPRWTVDPHFDLSFHIRRQRLPEGGGWPELFEALSQFFTTPLDRSRPLWEIVLYSGLPEGRAVYALKMHHSMGDGFAVMHLLSRLHSRTREPSPDKPSPGELPAPELNEIDALRRQLLDDASIVPSVATKLGSAALRTVTNPVGGLKATARYAASLKRVVAPPVGSGSELLAGRSMSMRLSLIDVPFSDFRAAAKAAGGSVNDAYLAALYGGYRRYHEAMGVEPPESIPTGFPISLRTADEAASGGNRIAAARIPGPVAEADPVQRIARIRELTQAARNEPAVDVMGVASPALARLPAPVLAAAVGPLTARLQLMASNVPGIGRGHYLAGAEVLRFFGYGRSGAAALITFITSGDLASVGVGFDPAAITEPKLFLECLVEGFVEILDLHPGSGKPVLRG